MGWGGVFDRKDVLDVMHGRSRMTIGQMGGGYLINSQKGILRAHTIVGLRGHTFSTSRPKGGSLCTLLRYGAVSPNNVDPKKRVYVLSIDCEYLTSAS